MSKLDELIKEYCPDGVEYKKIGELAYYEQPSKYIVSSTDYSDDFNVPVLTAGQSFILGYTNERHNLYEASKENPVIIFDDFTGAFKWVDFGFKVKSSAMKMITANASVTTLRYLYHLMGYLNFSSDEHKRLWISIYSELLVPVPPLPVQEEIVRILDTFTELTAELQAELQARKKQYEYYRDSLVSMQSPMLTELLKEYCPDGVEHMALKDAVVMQRGTSITKAQSHDGIYPVISGGREPAFYCNVYNRDGETITVAGSGAGAGYVQYWNVPIFANDSFTVKGNDSIATKYVYYFLSSIQEKIMDTKKGGGVPHVHISDIENFKIPIPPLSVQEEIVRILDNFSALCSDISSGLPAETEARQNQYEYYRDKLLTFKPL